MQLSPDLLIGEGVVGIAVAIAIAAPVYRLRVTEAAKLARALPLPR